MDNRSTAPQNPRDCVRLTKPVPSGLLDPASDDIDTTRKKIERKNLNYQVVEKKEKGVLVKVKNRVGHIK